MLIVFNVPFIAEGFAARGSYRGVLRFDEGDLAYSLFVTGRAPADQARHGDMSVWEWVHRVSLVPAYIRRGPTGRLMKSALADSLDRSEKVSLSYALGQAMTAVFCRQEVGVTHLMHLDRYASRWRMTFGATRRRPDLFGRVGPSRWAVAEAKGRSNGMEANLRRVLLAQKGSVRSIAGHTPAVTLGCVASFPVLSGGARGPMRVDVFDPEPANEAVDLTITEDRFFRAYYEPFVNAIDAGTLIESNGEYLVSSFLQGALRMGIRTDLYQVVKSSEVISLQQFDSSKNFNQALRLRSDGTIVEANFGDAFALNDYET